MKLNIQVRKIVEKDWEYLPSWWKGYDGWESEIPREFIPENGLGGFIICKGNDPVAACWLYLTNSKLGCINPFVADPLYRDTDRKEILKELLRFMTMFARDMGCLTLWGHTQSPTMGELYKELEWDVDPSFEVNMNL